VEVVDIDIRRLCLDESACRGGCSQKVIHTCIQRIYVVPMKATVSKRLGLKLR